MSQVIQGSNLRLLFADTPPSVTNSGASTLQPAPYPPGGYSEYQNPYAAPIHYGEFSGYGQPLYHPPMRNPQGIGRDEILIVSDDRVLGLRRPQRHMSDTLSMVSMRT